MKWPFVTRRRYEADLAAARSRVFATKEVSKLRASTRRRILVYVESCPYSPTVREIMAEVGLASPSTVQKHLDRLEKDGLIRRGGLGGDRIYPTSRTAA